MKTNFKILGAGALLALAVPFGLLAQTEPIIAVEFTDIAVLNNGGQVVDVKVSSGGSGYISKPTVTVIGGSATPAVLDATIRDGKVAFITVVAAGAGYTTPPLIQISAPGVAATATATTAGGPTGSPLAGISLSSGGSGYATPPAVTIAGGGGSGATATATVDAGVVTGITLTSAGTGYTSAPAVTIAAPGTTATAEVVALGDFFADPGQNESFGPMDVFFNMKAQARGPNPAGGFSYQFFINGVAYGSSVNPEQALGGFGVVSWAPPQPGSYTLTVTATGGGHTATSLPIRYHAVGTTVIGPSDNTLVPNGSTVVVQATATPTPSIPGATAFVSRVEFWVDGALAATDNTYPYSFIYTPAPSPTTHTIEARGYDNNGALIVPFGGNKGTRRVHMIAPTGTPPLVRIVNPPNEGSIQAGSSASIIADAISPNGFIRRVEFYLNGMLHSTSTTFPFTASWTPAVPGRYEFLAVGTDDKGNAVASEPIMLTATGSFPTVAIIDPPSSGLTVVQGSTLPVTVRAGGPDGGITSIKSIEFLVDGVVNDVLPKASTTTGDTTSTTPILTEPFVFNWKSNVTVGTHRLTARVTGVNNLVITSAEVTVNVIANQPPQVAITSPGDASSLTINVPATITTSVSDRDGSVASVDFLVNGAKIGSATKSPFEISWTPTTAGTFEITARAIDNGGASTTSSVLSVIVDPPAPAGQPQTNVAHTVYRGDYGSIAESGRFAFAVNRNNRGTFIGYSSAPTGRTHFWTDIPINPDGTFTVRDAGSQVVLSGQTSPTGVSGNFGGRTFIGPVTSSTGSFAPLLVTGTLTGVPASQVVAIVGGDGSVTLYAASGAGREVGTDFVTTSGNYSFASANGGRFAGTAASSAGLVSGTVSGSVSGSFLLRQQASRITNISTRTLAGAGDRTLVAGFVVSGTGNKPLLVRAVGPTLANFGVANPLADPNLTILRGSTSVATNNDWGNAASLVTLAAQVGAFPLTPGSRDAAAQVSLAPGTYTAVVGGGTATLGSSLIEIYDADTANPVTSRVTNISTRGMVGPGEALIAGFVITGDVRKKLLIRAVGPTLSSFGLTGLLADPRIEVMSGTTSIATNNDWTETASFAQVNTVSPIVGAFPLNSGSRDAATVLQLSPGSYTVQVTGAGTSTGTVLVEVYDADL
jgi:hypothetical protein